MFPDATDLHTEELRARVVWLIRLRWMAAAGVAVVVWAAPRLVGVPLPSAPLYALAATLASYNLLLVGIGRWFPRIIDGPALFWFVSSQVAADLVLLTALLHFSGGVENPFVCYYVFHIVIASILLPRHVVYLHVALAVALLAGLAGLEAWGLLPHYHLGNLRPGEAYRSWHYLLAVLFVVATMLSITAFMATAITARLRDRERQIVDLTASLRAHGEELEQAYESLRQLEKEKSEYMHRAAHHLRTPLAAAESMLAVVAEGRTGPVPEKAHEMVQRSRDRIRGMLDLARDLLILSRAREASAVATREMVDLRALLHSMEPDFQREAAAKGLALEIADGEAVVPGVAESLAELLENLVSNAIRYTPAGGKVRVCLSGQAGGLELCVSDTGIGIPEGEQSMIFDDFYRAGNARGVTRDGTGLGLSIVKAITAAHDATLHLDSREGQGTTFRVRFPPREVTT
jgi:signal transduction histidine kinase